MHVFDLIQKDRCISMAEGKMAFLVSQQMSSKCFYNFPPAIGKAGGPRHPLSCPWHLPHLKLNIMVATVWLSKEEQIAFCLFPPSIRQSNRLFPQTPETCPAQLKPQWLESVQSQNKGCNKIWRPEFIKSKCSYLKILIAVFLTSVKHNAMEKNRSDFILSLLLLLSPLYSIVFALSEDCCL